MRHLLYHDRFDRPISRIMFGDSDPQDVTTDASPYEPTEARPEYVRQLKLLAIHAVYSGLDLHVLPALRTRPAYTETVPALITALQWVTDDKHPNADPGVRAHFFYIDGDHSEPATAMLYTPQHGSLRPSFIHVGDLQSVTTSGAIRVTALRAHGHA